MSSVINFNSEYKQWLSEIKLRIKNSQIKATVKVNQEMLRLYWSLGADICEKEIDAKWGTGFFNQLSKDLRTEFPDATGFSQRNLRYCKSFYQFYNQSHTILHQVGAELESKLFSIPWRHHVEIITKCKNVDEALFYVQQTIENGWSRNENALPSIEEIEKDLEN